ncbi:MAG: hypothetical protein ABIP79_13930 [Chitinophagaceae bacterium]
MKQIAKVLTITFFIGFVLSSCKKDKAIQQEVNKPPVANAGFDRVIILPEDSVVLSGSGTDTDGMIVSSGWTKLRGPSQFTFVSSSNLITKVINLVEGKYEFQFHVTDNGGLTARDIVVVTVLSSFDPCYGCWDY